MSASSYVIKSSRVVALSMLIASLVQATRPDTVVFAIVRNKKGSFHLAAAVANLKNVHVFEADVVDHASLEVRHPFPPANPMPD